LYCIHYTHVLFREESKVCISDIVHKQEKRRAEAMAAKKAGKVAQSEIEEMRDMLKNGDLTNEHTIGTYMNEFSRGKKGQKPAQSECPIFMLLKEVPNHQLAELIKAANNRGRKAQSTTASYFKRSSLVQFLVAPKLLPNTGAETKKKHIKSSGGGTGSIRSVSGTSLDRVSSGGILSTPKPELAPLRMVQVASRSGPALR
jgi:hypothetical protein